MIDLQARLAWVQARRDAGFSCAYDNWMFWFSFEWVLVGQAMGAASEPSQEVH